VTADARKDVLVDNSADPEQVDRAQKVEKRRLGREVADLRKVLSTYEGRRFLYRLMDDCGLLKNTFHPDKLHNYFMQGERNVALRLMDKINLVSPDAFALMVKEWEKEE
jgi:hypothetical protein